MSGVTDFGDVTLLEEDFIVENEIVREDEGLEIMRVDNSTNTQSIAKSESVSDVDVGQEVEDQQNVESDCNVDVDVDAQDQESERTDSQEVCFGSPYANTANVISEIDVNRHTVNTIIQLDCRSDDKVFESITFNKETFESTEVVQLQQILFNFNKLLDNVSRLPRNDLLRLRSYIDIQFRNLDLYLSDHAVSNLCLDSDQLSGVVTHEMFVERMLLYEQQSRMTAGFGGIDFNKAQMLQLRLLELTYPVRVITVRKYLKDIMHAIEVTLGFIYTHNFPLQWKTGTY